MNLFSSVITTIGGVLNLIDTNIDTLEKLSKAGNIKAKSFSNALAFDEKIKQELRSSDEYKNARMNKILKEELERVEQEEDEEQEEETSDGLKSDINDMINSVKF